MKTNAKLRVHAKLGLYAKYSKVYGFFTGGTRVMHAKDAYKSNNNSETYIWNLITDDPDLIYKTKDCFDIPKKIEVDEVIEEMYYCEICGNSFKENEMDYIAEDGDELCSTCINCAENIND
jgi:hypothetical protein